MRITIELTMNEVRVLGGWASLSRTLDNARWCASDLLESDATDRDGDPEGLLSELRELHRPLSDVHTKIRAAIWEQWTPREEEIIRAYGVGEITTDRAEEELVAIGRWRWRAREILRELPDRMKPPGAVITTDTAST